MRDRSLEDARRKREEYRRREIAALQKKCRQRRVQVKELRAEIERLSHAGTAILLSTHNAEAAASLCHKTLQL